MKRIVLIAVAGAGIASAAAAQPYSGYNSGAAAGYSSNGAAPGGYSAPNSGPSSYAAYSGGSYGDAPISYPWRNGAIEGPAGPGAPPPTSYAGPSTGGYYPGGGGYPPPGGPTYYPGGPAYGAYGPTVFPLPDGSGSYAVSQGSDGTLQVTRFGPVWSSRVGQDGWSHRHYFNYGWWPFSGIWPFN